MQTLKICSQDIEMKFGTEKCAVLIMKSEFKPAVLDLYRIFPVVEEFGKHVYQ